jgi:hypothetical protein
MHYVYSTRCIVIGAVNLAKVLIKNWKE